MRRGPRLQQFFTMACQRPRPPSADECCVSGCISCIWIDYAERLIDYHLKRLGNFQEAGESLNSIHAIIRQEVNTIDDKSVRDFILSELDIRIREAQKLLK